MQKFRKLQYIGNQFLLNIPRSLVAKMGWQKGDYFAVSQMDNEALEILKVGAPGQVKWAAALPTLEQQALSRFAWMFENIGIMKPETFSLNISELGRQLGQLRRYKTRAKIQEPNNTVTNI